MRTQTTLIKNEIEKEKQDLVGDSNDRENDPCRQIMISLSNNKKTLIAFN